MTRKKLQFEDCVDWYLRNPQNDESSFGYNTSTDSTNVLHQFIDKPFYCWDAKKLHNDTCCFNHIIGLPEYESTRKPNPLFDYEKLLYDAWEKHKHIWVLKATGLGVTEFFLRLMMWLALRNNDYKNAQFCIIVGPNIDLAKKLIHRMKAMVRDMIYTQMETSTQVSFEVNGVWIQAFPSNHLDAYRSLARPKFIFVDEADFFKKGEQEDVRKVSERYIAKSRPWIVLISTPNKPDELMQTIERETPSIYHKIKLGYEWGLNKIYDQEAIELMKQSPNFEQEYNLKYEGKVGNVFSPPLIQQCIDLGHKWAGTWINVYNYHPVGVDYGYSSSKTVICVGEWDTENKVLRIVRMDDFGDMPPTPQLVADRLFDIYMEFGQNTHFFVDGSNAGSVNQAKIKFGESMNWRKQDAFNKRDRIHPIHFGVDQEHRKLLFNMFDLCTKGMLAINEQYDKLITSMRTAQMIDWDLNKDETVHNDYLDACRLMCRGIVLKR